jgi:6-phosphogluconolactonase (cycloisomerase 2 family)
MRNLRLAGKLAIVCTALGLSGCPEDRAPPTPSNPAPTLSAISPTTATAGGPGFTLTATGASFVPGSVVRWAGFARPTTLVSPTELRATLSAGDIGAPGTYEVTVLNPGPGGGLSGGVPFTVTAPAPTLTALSPPSTLAGGPPFVLTVTGSSFVTGSVVRWNGSDRPTAIQSGGELRASITAADIASPGTAEVAVFTPGPGGGTSATLTFSILGPVPSLTAVTPPSAVAGGASLILGVAGSGFLPSSVVRWNGADRPTSFLGSSLLQVTIPGSDIAVAGTASITVFTPAPGGGTSNALSFPVSSPLPVASSLSPSSVIAGAADFSLQVDGSGFVPNSVVRWNGADRPTTFASATRLRAAIGAADVAAAGTAQVTVFNPAPGGGTSSAVSFFVSNPVPGIAMVAPPSVLAGSPAFVLTVDGSGFLPGSVVRWNGSARTTVFVSGTRLQASISSDDVAAAGVAEVTVFNPAPGGGPSAPASFTVLNPAPTLSGRTPASALVSSPGLLLTITGGGFVPASVVRWNGSDRATTFDGPTQLRATIPASDLATAGTAAVTVFSPGPGGGESTSLDFTVQNPVPTIVSLSPPGADAGAASANVRVAGMNFVPGSVVRYEGSDRTTTFVSATEVRATLGAADLASAGTTAAVTVFNPGPGGGTSNAEIFTVAPVPRFAFVVNSSESGPLGSVGLLSAYAIENATGQLRPWGYVTLGEAVRFVATSGDFAVVSYQSGNAGFLQVYQVDPAKGLASRGSTFLSGSTNASAVTVTGRFVYALHNANPGSIFAYTMDATGELTPIAGSPFAVGADPNSLTADPAGRFLYVVNGTGRTVSAFTIDGMTGALTAVGAAVATGANPFSIRVDPSGRFVYVANVGDSSVSAYSINQTTGALSPITGSPFRTGENPVRAEVDPAGRFLYVARFATPGVIETYAINSATGAISAAGSPVNAGSLTSSFYVEPSGRFGYAVNAGSRDVTAFQVNRTTGALTALPGPVRARAPLLMAIAGGKLTVRHEPRFLYAANNGSNDVSMEVVSPQTGALTSAASPVEAGTSPVAMASDLFGRFAYVVGQGSENVAMYAIDSIAGTLSEIAPPVDTDSAPTAVAVDPTALLVYVANGGSATVSRFSVDFDGRLLATVPPVYSVSPGTSPVALAIEPTGRYLYVANGGSNNVSAFTIRPSDGDLAAISGSPFAAGTAPAALAPHPTGRFLYVANSGSNNVSAFSITAATGALVAVAGSPFAAGMRPAGLAVDPSGRFLRVVSRDDGLLRTFSIDLATGALTAAGTNAAGTQPVSVAVDPSGRFVYALNRLSEDVHVFAVDGASGALTPVSGSPFPVGTFPSALLPVGAIR